MAEPGKILDIRGIWHSVFDQDNTSLRVTSSNVDLGATENHIGQVGGHTAVVNLQGTTTAEAHSAGDVIWNPIEVAGVFRTGGPYTGVIQSVLVQDDDDLGENLDLVFLSGNSSLGSPGGAVSMTDNDNVLGVVNITTWDDHINSQCSTEVNVGLAVQSTSTSLWVGAIARGTPTFTSTKAITVRMGVLQD